MSRDAATSETPAVGFRPILGGVFVVSLEGRFRRSVFQTDQTKIPGLKNRATEIRRRFLQPHKTASPLTRLVVEFETEVYLSDVAIKFVMALEPPKRGTAAASTASATTRGAGRAGAL